MDSAWEQEKPEATRTRSAPASLTIKTVAARFVRLLLAWKILLFEVSGVPILSHRQNKIYARCNKL